MSGRPLAHLPPVSSLALEALARVSAIPVKIDKHVPVRFSDSVESTAATVRPAGDEAGLRFDVVDDGHGFDPEAGVTGFVPATGALATT
ncbi:hypothetical protein OM076_07290 [Solirubrobacter ginsenosidimutans]|uniref:Uncharacterized protein n=1 Tax=Solirubrobacter ginsenosidimutans TaxID=490573 RepID=A0A9X3MPR8_9ACTN|nr:hypothetical protein [Solirubrobacter ginsenosidimutans]MDA0160060.1 hypothetical protein [Solirubrobacter ginsenosidimutans]